MRHGSCMFQMIFAGVLFPKLCIFLQVEQFRRFIRFASKTADFRGVKKEQIMKSRSTCLVEYILVC